MNLSERIAAESKRLSGEDVVSRGDVTQTTSLSERIAAESKRLSGEDVVEEQPVMPHLDESEPSGWTQFNYGFDKTGNILSNFGDYLEARVPMGNLFVDGEFYQSPDERYGEGYSSMSVADRRKRIVDYRNEQLAIDFPTLHAITKNAAGKEGYHSTSLYQSIGSIASALADPSILLPIGQTYKAATAIGAGLGYTHSVLEDLVKPSGDVSQLKAAVYTGAGAALAPIVKAGGAVVGRALQKRKDNNVIKKADEQIEQVNLAVSRAVSEGSDDIAKVVEEITGYSNKEVQELALVANKKLREPTKEEAIIEQELLGAIYQKQKTGVNKFADGIIGVMSTRLNNLSKPVFGRMRKHEFLVSVKTKDAIETVAPLSKIISSRKIPAEVRNTLFTHVNNGNFDSALKILKPVFPEAEVELTKVRGMLDDFYVKLKESGYDIPKTANYFPRVLKDREGLLNSLGFESRGTIQKALQDRAEQLKLSSAKDLDTEDVDLIINQVVRGYKSKTVDGKLKFTKSRTLPTLTEEMNKFYETPAKSLDTYVRTAVNDIQKRQFFGKNVVTDSTNKTDVNASIGSFVSRELVNGNLDIKVADDVAELLQARFSMGEQAPHKVFQFLRNFGYTTTLANPLSAAVQLGDIGVSAYYNGIGNTIKGMLSRNLKDVNLKELGLDDLINHELNNAIDSSVILGKALQYSGFRAMDRFGKNTFLRGAYLKATKMVKSKEGLQKLSKKYRSSFGADEFNMLVNELKAGEVTDRVKLYLFNELSDTQPISLSEVPTSYLNNPNGRIFYALKSFTIKQLDIMRRDIYQQYKEGDKKGALRNATAYFLLVGGGNGMVQEAKQMMLMRDADIKNIPDNMVEHIFRNAFAGEFIRERYGSKGAVVDMVVSTITPPLGALQAPFMDAADLINKGDLSPERTIRQIPVGGELWYNYFGGGLENYLKREKASK